MKIYILILAVMGTLMSTYCKAIVRDSFSVEITHVAEPWGNVLLYTLNQDSLVVMTNCENVGCKRKIVYKRLLKRSESKHFYSFLRSLQTDTLKEHYDHRIDFSDGDFSHVTIKGRGLPFRKVDLDNQDIPATTVLFNEIDRLVFDKKYQLPFYTEHFLHQIGNEE